jgi:prepilin-type N-terminal cleavage/methylation domain-containing protein
MHRTNCRRNRFGKSRSGFTLIELLVVITIIGVLVGITVPAVLAARTYFTRAAIKMEVQGLADAFEKYRSKHGDYPPDGSSWPVMEAHLRKAFPNILISELNLLNPSFAANAYVRNDYAGRVMDPAEALVFFLGGFSTDAQRPFTGPGGPFVASSVVVGAYRYNGSRQNPMYEFPGARLTLRGDPGELVSTDEEIFGTSANPAGTVVDLLPVFMCYANKLESGNPYVYFDHRTYQGGLPASPIFNFHRTNRVDTLNVPYVDVARPMLAESGVYEHLKTFQIASPGLDGRYGGDTAIGNPVLFNVKGLPMVWSATKFIPASSNFGPFKLQSLSGAGPMYDNCVDVIEASTLGANL